MLICNIYDSVELTEQSFSSILCYIYNSLYDDVSDESDNNEVESR